MLAALLLALTLPLHAAVIGTSKPAEAITQERILKLPSAQQQAWLRYLTRSKKQLTLDQAALAAERAHLAGPLPPLPKEGGGARSMPLHRDAAFYRSPEALHTADTILSFQLPNGGWSKNMDMSGPARLPGQSFTPNNISHYLGQDDFDKPANPDWNYAGTLDNDATNTELHFLAQVSTALPGRDGDKYRDAFIKGIQYLLDAQFPNGGWPQVWPLEGGYHDAITYNDNAVTESATLLSEVGDNKDGQFSFILPGMRTNASSAAAHAIQCILNTQVIIAGKRTVWAQQHDALTLAPVAGRNFEPAAISAGESADILVYLMSLPHPSPAIIASVNAGVTWLRDNAIHDMQWSGTRPGVNGGTGRHLTAAPGAPAIWPRYTSIQTGKPIFGDRDKTIHDNVEDLTSERRNGYAWYSPGPQTALDAYDAWIYKKK